MIFFFAFICVKFSLYLCIMFLLLLLDNTLSCLFLRYYLLVHYYEKKMKVDDSNLFSTFPPHLLLPDNTQRQLESLLYFLYTLPLTPPILKLY